MITIHSANADDFSTLGIGALQPVEAVVEEQAGAMYQLTLTHPMDSRGRWRHLQKYNIIKAPAPTRETPEIAIDGESTPGTTITRQIYKVQTPSGMRLHLRQSASLSGKIVRAYSPGTEVVRVSVSGDWAKVVICAGGATGYMWADYLTFVRTETETTPGVDRPGRTIQARQTREQLFRISKPEKDDARAMVSVTALHITFDLAYNAIEGELKLENVPANQAVERIMAAACDEHPFAVWCNSTKPVSGDFTDKSVASALWGDGGVLAQIAGRLIRDNYDIFILDDEERDLGVEIRHGKNLTGAVAYEDVTGTYTRIIPVGKDEKGNRLTLAAPGYVESPRANLVPVVRSKTVKYDVQIGQDGIADADAARKKLTELALADFEAGVDGHVTGLDVDFIQLENTMEYARYAGLQTIHLYDTVHVISTRSNIRSAVRMTGYRYRVSGRKPRYIETTLGQIVSEETRIYGYDIADGTISGTKVLPGSIGGAAIADGALDYAKLSALATGLLQADAIHAVTANINEIVAGKLTADAIAAGSITAEKIAADAITAEKIKAGAVEAKHLDAGSVTSDKIAAKTITADNLQAYLITAESGLIADAAIGAAQIADGSITSAKIVELSADVIKTGTLSAERLIIVGDDGLIYRINANAAGLTASQLTEDQYRNYINGTVIVAKSITAAQIAAETITGNEILAGSIKAANIDVVELFASEATIAQLNAADISGNKYLRLAVDGVKVGGTNLIVQGRTSAGYVDYTGTLVALAGYRASDFIPVEPGAEIVFQEWAETAGTLWRGAAYYDAEKAHIRDRNVGEYAYDTDHVSDVYTVPENAAYVRVSYTWTDGCRVKLEQGNKATDWSPSPEEVRIGSSIEMDENHIRLNSPHTSISIPSENSDDAEEIAAFDENGLSAEAANIGKINSDSVVPTQASAAFAPANGGELQAYLDNLSGHYIQGNVTIDASAVTGGVFTLDGLMGEGFLRIDGGTLNGLTVTRCTAPVYLYNNTFATAGTAVKALMSTLYLYRCDITAALGLDLSNGWTKVILDGCTGTCTKLASVKYQSVLTVLNGTPYGPHECTAGGEIYTETEFTEAPGSAETPEITELKLTATSKTWGGSWLSGNDLYQGAVGGGTLRRGCMWFDRTGIAGKAVKSAVLKLTRISGIGGGGDVSVKIYGTTTASASGTPNIGTLFAQTNIAGGATKAVDVTAAVQALADGTISGLLLYDERTDTFGSKNYTYGYAKFSGTPVLELTLEG